MRCHRPAAPYPARRVPDIQAGLAALSSREEPDLEPTPLSLGEVHAGTFG
jgi:hypothetical protein